MTFEQKRAAAAKYRQRNYEASLRLEGMEVPAFRPLSKQAILKKYQKQTENE